MNQAIFEMNSREITCPHHGKVTEKGVFDKWFGCPQCSQQAANDIEKERKEQERQQNIQNVGLPLLYRDLTFKGWVKTDERQVPILERSLKYAKELEDLKSVPNLVLSGNTGTGKTHIAACIMRFAANRMVRGRYTTSAEIMAEIRASYDFKSGPKQSADILRDLGNVPLLMIDEVGIGDTITGSDALWSILIDWRYRNQLPTIMTTNLPKEKLKAHIGDRAYDRLQERCVWANCVWVSYRQLKKEFQEL